MSHRVWPPNRELSDWIKRQFPAQHRGNAVDVGASDGVSINSTLGLEESGWKVLCIEPNPQFHAELRKVRKLVLACACDRLPAYDADFYVHFDCPEAFSSLRPVTNHPASHPKPNADWGTIRVPVMTLEQCLRDAGFDRLDALCVDTEGTEMDVLRGLDLACWKPRVIVSEAWDEGALDDLLTPLGYQREWRTADNDCYALIGGAA